MKDDGEEKIDDNDDTTRRRGEEGNNDQGNDKIKKSVKFEAAVERSVKFAASPQPSIALKKSSKKSREELSELLIKRQSVAALKGKGIVSNKLLFDKYDAAADDEVKKAVRFENVSETRTKRFNTNRDKLSASLIKRQSVAALQGSNRVNELIGSHSAPPARRGISKRESLANMTVGLKERKNQLAENKMAGIKESNDDEEEKETNTTTKGAKSMKRPSLIRKHPSLTLTEENSVNKLIDSHQSQGIKREISKHPSLAFLGEIDQIKNKLSSKNVNYSSLREVGKLGNIDFSASDEEGSSGEEDESSSRKIKVGEGSVNKTIESHESGIPSLKREISKHPSLAQLGEIDPIKNKLSSTRDEEDDNNNEGRKVGKLRLSVVTESTEEDNEERDVGKLKLSALDDDNYEEKEGREVGKLGNRFSVKDNTNENEKERGRNRSSRSPTKPSATFVDSKLEEKLLNPQRNDTTTENRGRRRNRFSLSPPKSTNVTFVDSKLEEKLKTQTRRTSLGGGGRTSSPPPEHHIHFEKPLERDSHKPRAKSPPPTVNVKFDTDPDLEKELSTTIRPQSPPPENHIHFNKGMDVQHERQQNPPPSPPPEDHIHFHKGMDVQHERQKNPPPSPPPEDHIHFHKGMDVQHERQQNPPPSPPPEDHIYFHKGMDVQHERQQNPPPSPPPIDIFGDESFEKDQSSPGESFKNIITTKFAGGPSNNQMPIYGKFHDEGDALPIQFSGRNVENISSTPLRNNQYEEDSMLGNVKERYSPSDSSSEHDSLIKAKASIDAIFPTERDGVSGVRSTTELASYEKFHDEGDDAFQRSASNKKKQFSWKKKFSWGNIESINRDEERSILDTSKDHLAIKKREADKKAERNLCLLAIVGSVMILIGVVFVIISKLPSHKADASNPTIIKGIQSEKLSTPSLLDHTSSSPQLSKECSDFSSISDNGTLLSSFDNLGSQAIFLPFPIFWNGDAQTYTRIIVNKRGTIFFGDSMPTHDLKDVSGIYSAWAYATENDKHKGEKYHGNIYTSLDKTGSIFIISWEDVILKEEQSVSFQIALHLNGKIEMRWGDGSLPESHRVIAFLVDSHEQRIGQTPSMSDDSGKKGKKVLGINPGEWPANTCRTFLPSKDFYSTFDP